MGGLIVYDFFFFSTISFFFLQRFFFFFLRFLSFFFFFFFLRFLSFFLNFSSTGREVAIPRLAFGWNLMPESSRGVENGHAYPVTVLKTS